jgi:hypothetical protein
MPKRIENSDIQAVMACSSFNFCILISSPFSAADRSSRQVFSSLRREETAFLREMDAVRRGRGILRDFGPVKHVTVGGYSTVMRRKGVQSVVESAKAGYSTKRES